jgi:hypothetical protein
MAEIYQWFMYTVIFGMVPIYIKLLFGITRKTERVTFTWMFAGGELLLISAVIACNAIGKLAGCDTSHPFLEKLAIPGCLLLIIISSIWFADVSANKSNAKIDRSVVATGSVVLFAVDIVLSGCCIYCSV